MNKRNIFFKIFIIMLTISFLPNYGLTFSLPAQHKTLSVNKVSTSGISIGEGNINTTASSGNGTQENPYIIENLSINQNYYIFDVYVTNVNSYFIMRNIILAGPNGIDVIGTQHGTFSNITIVTGGTGIKIENSNNNNFFDNNITSSKSLTLTSSSNNTLARNIISISSGQGISLLSSEFNNLTDNKIITSFNQNQILNNPGIMGLYLNGYGIYLYGSPNNILQNNELINNGISIYANNIQSFFQLKFINNTVNGKPIILLQHKSNETVPTNTGELLLINCSFITIKDLSIANTTAVSVFFSSNITIANNTFNQVGMGISLWNSTNISILHNTLDLMSLGLNITNSHSINIANNQMLHSYQLANLYNTYDLTFQNNVMLGTSNLLGISNYGISISQSNMVNFIDNKASNFYNFLSIRYSTHLKLKGNNCENVSSIFNTYYTNYTTIMDNKGIITGLGGGIALEVSNSNYIANNTFKTYINNPNLPFYVPGIVLSGSSNNTIIFNQLLNMGNGIELLPRTLLGFTSFGTQDNNISSNTITGTINGIVLSSTDYNMIVSNSIRNCSVGVWEKYSFYNTFKGNSISLSQTNGFELYNSSSNFFTANNVTNNGESGFNLTLSNDNTISNNTMDNNTLNGLYAMKSNTNNITWNLIEHNANYGIDFNNSKSNTVSLNSFIANGNHSSQAYSNGQNVFAENGYGNYWNDYTGKSNSNSKIGSQPYAIDGPAHNTDPDPLLVPPQELFSQTNTTGTNFINLEQAVTVGVVGLLVATLGSFAFLYNDFRKHKLDGSANSSNKSFSSYFKEKFRKSKKGQKVNASLSDKTMKELEELMDETKE